MRRLVIDQTNYGQYRIVNTEGKKSVGSSLESAIGKLLPEVPEDVRFHAFQVIDSLLGSDKPGAQGQIHEGVVSA